MATSTDTGTTAVPTKVRPEDEKVPVASAFFFGLQHILAKEPPTGVAHGDAVADPAH